MLALVRLTDRHSILLVFDELGDTGKKLILLLVCMDSLIPLFGRIIAGLRKTSIFSNVFSVVIILLDLAKSFPVSLFLQLRFKHGKAVSERLVLGGGQDLKVLVRIEIERMA